MQPHVTERAREAFLHGFEETRRLHHGSVRAEHILLGVLRLSRGSASEALDAAGVDREILRRGLEERLPPAEMTPHEGEYPYHASGTALIQQLFTPKSDGRGERITSGRVLLALLSSGRSPMVEALGSARVDLDSLKERLSAEVDESE